MGKKNWRRRWRNFRYMYLCMIITWGIYHITWLSCDLKAREHALLAQVNEIAAERQCLEDTVYHLKREGVAASTALSEALDQLEKEKATAVSNVMVLYALMLHFFPHLIFPSLPPLSLGYDQEWAGEGGKGFWADQGRPCHWERNVHYLSHILLFISIFSCPHSRAHLASEVESLQNRLKEANLNKSVAEAKLADFEREKKMIELDIQESLVRHKSDVTEQMSKSFRVYFMWLPFAIVMWCNVYVAVCDSHVAVYFHACAYVLTSDGGTNDANST